ncbi:ABC transporter permease [Neobacillus drentensis]|uniref:ABC transporter permease n=1 Tax=Neobacillus drentensis TaxID=220684 RepID=UPI002FFEB396
MKAVINVIKEQIENFYLIFRLASYDIKGRYQSHYLGVAWQFINPAMQIIIYWLVFGLGIRSGHPIGSTPFFVYMILGAIPWFFISSAIIQGSNSVYNKVSLVSKMKFPVSVLPSITIVSNIFNLIFMLLILGVILYVYRINPGIYLLQLPYFILCMVIFLFAVTLLFSTIATMARDFQLALQSFMRMMIYVLPVLWDMEKLSLLNFFRLNPLYYLIDGFRKTFLVKEWFFHDWKYMLYFWIITLLMLFIGSIVHIRFRKQFVDYI